MDSALNKNESELSVLVLSVSLQVLSDVDGLLNQVVEVLGDLRGQTILLQDSEDLIASDALDLRDTVVVSQNDTDLGGRGTLLANLTICSTNSPVEI